MKIKVFKNLGMKTNFISYIFAFLIFCLMGCQSAVKSAREAGEGHFRARTLIKDKKQARSFIVNLSFNVSRGKVLRMDATSPLNQHLASFLITPKKLSYFIVPEKVYYQGAPQPKAFARFMAVPLDPEWLENLLFREAFVDKDWNCTKDKNGKLVSCLNRRERLNVSWGDNQDSKLVVKVTHPQGEIQMNFHRIQPKVEKGVSLTALSIPKGFRQIR